MSAVVVRFPRGEMTRPKYKQKAMSCIVRRFRAAHPGHSERWYWDLAVIFDYYDYTLEECLRHNDTPAFLAHSWAMFRKAKGRADTYEVIRFPTSRVQGDLRGQHGGRG